MFHEDTREHAHTLFDWNALFIIDFNPFHSAAGGIALEYKTAKTVRFQFPYTFFGPHLHPVCHILSCPDRHQPGRIRIALQVHGLPWNMKAATHFGTDRYIFHVLPKRVGQKTVMPVPSVITHIFTEQAGAYSQSDLFH